MKISAKGRYAISLMIDLAMYNTGEPVSLKDIARRQDIPEKYLEQIVSVMNRAGFVRAVRGAGGGYILRVDPKNLKVSMILGATENGLVPTEQDREDIKANRISDEVFIRVYDTLNDAVLNSLSSISLSDMIEWQNESIGNYCI